MLVKGSKTMAAVILAAGASARLGRPKALLTIGGRSLLRHVVDCAAGAGCEPVIVVLGAGAEAVRSELSGLAVEMAYNPDWSRGLGSSVRAGIRALEAHPAVGAAVLLVCDQPRLDAELIRGLHDAFERAGGRMVACAYAGTLGVPAIFPRSRFHDLLGLGDDQGAKAILLRDESQVVRVDWPDGALDVDTVEDLGRLHPENG
jgi:molybdenum cofactor cytidylyltransferase